MIVDFIIELIKNVGIILLALVGLALLLFSFVGIIYGTEIGKPWLSVVCGVVFILVLGIIVTIIWY